MRVELTAIIALVVAMSASAAPKPKLSEIVMMGDSTTLSKRSPEGKKLTDCVHLTEEGNEMAARILAPVIYAEFTGKKPRKFGRR